MTWQEAPVSGMWHVACGMEQVAVHGASPSVCDVAWQWTVFMPPAPSYHPVSVVPREVAREPASSGSQPPSLSLTQPAGLLYAPISNSSPSLPSGESPCCPPPPDLLSLYPKRTCSDPLTPRGGLQQHHRPSTLPDTPPSPSPLCPLLPPVPSWTAT